MRGVVTADGSGAWSGEGVEGGGKGVGVNKGDGAVFSRARASL